MWQTASMAKIRHRFCEYSMKCSLNVNKDPFRSGKFENNGESGENSNSEFGKNPRRVWPKIR